MKYTIGNMNQSSEQNTVLKRVNELIRSKYFTLAREALDRAIAGNPKSIPLRAKLVELYTATSDFQEAYRLLTELISEVPDNPYLHGLYPRVLVGAGRPDEGIAHAQKSLESGGFIASGILAELYENTSRTDELRDLLDRMKPKTPVEFLIRDYSTARLLLRDKEYERAVQLFEGILQRLDEVESIDDDGRHTRKVDCGFQLSKAYDRMGEYDSAWAAAARAHQQNASWAPKFSTAEYVRNLDSIVELMDRETLASLAHCQEELEWEPLYIVGNPRSGTSLLEQILSMHPDIANGGEMTVSMRLQEELPRLTDSYLGWPNSVLDMRTDDAKQTWPTVHGRPFSLQPGEEDRV